MTSPTSEAREPVRPADAAGAALFDALAAEHATIYGYGVVSAHAAPELNYLVSDSMAEHRARREAAIALLEERNVDVPLPAAGYSLPIRVDNSADAARLAIRMEQDDATAWRAVVEQARDEKVRAFGVAAMLETAVTAARWRRAAGDAPVVVAFPGGSE
ncbi:hypothetical protein Mycch_2043 [Mycolicibacterium chubuense NBB4]|uniref:DUF4439 domain-containing protein n=1 Tax=Mycolicibacterium chubuense (strain NBB4) TaxID=710421 RepID=I4BHR9_MYCCN|nr:ferritin-like domain-containing protein [Mycolicibacterium chubuense]AFM16826.1 hypothetical protein Mycch_2043 [Mycolicibacterium chubuense NBB4]